MSNLKGETFISVQVWSLLSFCNTSREGIVIYPFFFIFSFFFFFAKNGRERLRVVLMAELIGEARGVLEEIWKIIKLITQLTMIGKEISIDRDRYEREGIKIWKKKLEAWFLRIFLWELKVWCGMSWEKFELNVMSCLLDSV